MKKNFSLLLCALFVLCLGACGNKGDLYMPKEAVTTPQVEKGTEELKKTKDTEAKTKEDGVS